MNESYEVDPYVNAVDLMASIKTNQQELKNLVMNTFSKLNDDMSHILAILYGYDNNNDDGMPDELKQLKTATNFFSDITSIIVDNEYIDENLLKEIKKCDEHLNNIKTIF